MDKINYCINIPAQNKQNKTVDIDINTKYNVNNAKTIYDTTHTAKSM